MPSAFYSESHLVIIQSVASDIKWQTCQPWNHYGHNNLLLWMTDPKGCHLLLKVIHQSNLRQDREKKNYNVFVWRLMMMFCVLKKTRDCTCLRRRTISGLLMSMVAEPDEKLSFWDRKLDSTLLAEKGKMNLLQTMHYMQNNTGVNIHNEASIHSKFTVHIFLI